MITDAQIHILNRDACGVVLVNILDRVYAEGGNEAVVEKLNMWGLNSDDATEREAALTLARMWAEKRG